MARNKKKKKTWFCQRNDDAANNPFDNVNYDGWRDCIIQITSPKIPLNVQIKEHVYECIEAGSTNWPDQFWFVMGERYEVRKSRWSLKMVEVRGVFHNKNTGITRMYRSWLSLPLDSCKKYLKPW